MTPSPHFRFAPFEARLACHPARPCAHALDLRVEVSATDEALLLDFHMTGDVSALRLPPAGKGGAADGLWQHSCFEAFAAVSGEVAYREFNFSPSGQWAAYRFGGERVRDLAAEALHPAPPPSLRFEHSASALRLRVALPLGSLPPLKPRQALLLGLNAVIEDASGDLSYWAVRHPKPQPDFHDPGGRALRLPAPL